MSPEDIKYIAAIKDNNKMNYQKLTLSEEMNQTLTLSMEMNPLVTLAIVGKGCEMTTAHIIAKGAMDQ
jgi:hypothetical protein